VAHDPLLSPSDAAHAGDPTARLALGPPTSPQQGPILPGAPQEPLLETEEIQGNILAGFNKDYQTLLYLNIHDVEVAKAWLRVFATCVATLEEVLAFNRLFRAMKKRRRDEPCGLAATWMSIAFSYNGLKKLVPADAEKFESFAFAFKEGLPARSSLIGDPAKPGVPGHPSQWVVGGTAETTPDILVIVASDDPGMLKAQIDRLREMIGALPKPAGGDGSAVGLEIVGTQPGQTLPGKLRGHEHFGFKDGVSHPGVRGRVSTAPSDYLTPRYIDFTDQDRWLKYARWHGKPGQPLVWPGEFVLGHPRQKGGSVLESVPSQTWDPDWVRNGSFLVYRRLRQDVAAFWAFVTAKAEDLATKPGFSGMTAEKLASMLVGRWPSGAPIMRSPDHDRAELGADDLANNYFTFTDPAEQVPILDPDGGEGGGAHDFGPVPSADDGVICPYAAHIRKVVPRDDNTDIGAPSNSLRRLILRRGIPFGPPLEDLANPENDPANGERGLLFLCYQTSIDDQFEFLMSDWANQTDKPRESQDDQPAGHDPLIGQAHVDSNRTRRFLIRGRVGDGMVDETLELPRDWVVPTGGGYFFTPSISALVQVLSR
jgi:Dyp-type peroxidase family